MDETNIQTSVRTLDFARFTSGDNRDQSEFAHDLVDSFISKGFVKLINHGIQDEEIRRLFDFVRHDPVGRPAPLVADIVLDIVQAIL